MKLKIEDREYIIRWKHNVQSDDINPVTMTECHIKLNGIITSSGYSMLSKKDQYNRRIGRKVSLTRALRVFPKNTRRLFWEAYIQELGI